MTEEPASSGTPTKKPRRRWLRWCGYLTVGALLAGGGAWLLVHSTTWAGPLFANTLRAVVGTDNVARIEDAVYGVEDRINRFTRKGEKPRAHWQVPPPAATSSALVAAPGPMSTVRPPFVPRAVGPIFRKWSAPGDGEWVPVPDPRRDQAPIVLHKTLLHPDPTRSWAELVVVTVDLAWTELLAMPGTREPDPKRPLPAGFRRPGVVPVAERSRLLAAFNGGFMAEHGHYGMRAGSVTILPPRDTSCTVVGYADGSIEIATWKALTTPADQLNWFRQTPACMYENGLMHVGLRHPETRLWGATLDGDTVIRRSAIGLDESRLVLYVGISSNTTARALAEGMRHAGAVDVAQLDVNWSYPKFLTYALGQNGKLEAKPLMDGFEFSPGEYVEKSSLRDFFYILHRESPAPYAEGMPSPTPTQMGSAPPAASASTPPAASTSTPPAASTSTPPAATTSSLRPQGTPPPGGPGTVPPGPSGTPSGPLSRPTAPSSSGTPSGPLSRPAAPSSSGTPSGPLSRPTAVLPTPVAP